MIEDVEDVLARKAAVAILIKAANALLSPADPTSSLQIRGSTCFDQRTRPMMMIKEWKDGLTGVWFFNDCAATNLLNLKKRCRGLKVWKAGENEVDEEKRVSGEEEKPTNLAGHLVLAEHEVIEKKVILYQ